jgi:protein-disulfide isomerase
MRNRLFALLLVSVFGIPYAHAEAPVATVAGEPITRAELERHVRPQLIEIENNRYEALDQGLQEMVAEKLFEKEAQTRGLSVQQLRDKEIDAKITAPTDAEIQEVFDTNKAQLGNATLDDLKPRITAYLANQRAGERARAFLDELRAKYETKISLTPPKIEVGDGGRASRGGDKNAPITIIAFSDFECPYCKRSEETVSQVLDAYGDKIRYVFRDFPLPFHANAHEAAAAARCAGEQDKFWEYHDKLFQTAALSTENLQSHATALELDRTKFDECLASDKYDAEIDADVAAGSDVGVTGTPAFFINGRMLSGAQPFERFKEVIDAELARGSAQASN